MNEHLAVLLVFLVIGYSLGRYQMLTRKDRSYPRPQRTPKGLKK